MNEQQKQMADQPGADEIEEIAAAAAEATDQPVEVKQAFLPNLAALKQVRIAGKPDNKSNE